MNELGFKILVVLWLGFGIVSIVLFFRHGLNAAILRATARRFGAGGVAIGYALIALLMPLMLLLGTIPFLYVMVAEDKSGFQHRLGINPPEPHRRGIHPRRLNRR